MIHMYKLFDMNFVVDVNSACVHVVDEITYDLLTHFDENGFIDWKSAESMLEKYSNFDIVEAYSEVKELICEGMLYSRDDHRELVKVRSDSVVKALCLHISQDCNMRCKYCFAADSTLKIGGQMSEQVGKSAIDFVIANSGARHNIEVDFFGGEPLLNMDVIKKIVDYADKQGELNDKTFRFTLTTNGLLLNEDIEAFINRRMSNVVLSLDGRPEINDSMRILPTGASSYEKVADKFLTLAESRGQDNYYVRGTFTNKNLDFCADVLHLADLGFKQISLEPVVCDSGEDYAIREEHLPTIFAEYEKLAQALVNYTKIGRWFNFFHFMIDLEQGPCAVKRIAGCGVGHEYVAVDPSGNIYPCHQFVGNSKYLMGNVVSGEFDKQAQKTFQDINIYTRQGCDQCWAKFYCSGGCAACSESLEGDLYKPNKIACDLERKRVECAIALAAITKSIKK